MNETVESFNEKYPIGTPVRYWPVKGFDDHLDTVTRSEAWALGHGSFCLDQIRDVLGS